MHLSIEHYFHKESIGLYILFHSYLESIHLSNSVLCIFITSERQEIKVKL